MQAKWNLFWSLIPLLVSLAFIGWLMWRWLKASDEPYMLIVRWLISALVLGYVFVTAVRARDEMSKIVALLVACVGGVVMTLVWRQKFCDFVGDLFASLYTGGNQQVEPAPFYSIAQARRKQGRYNEAIELVRDQLTRFPTDFTGWMLLAEIQAEDLKDLATAHNTIQELLAQEGHAPKNIAFALSREADWLLKLAQDREGARAALEQIIQLLPETEQAQLALQRIAHLVPTAMLVAKKEPQRFAVPKQKRISAYVGYPKIQEPEKDPAVAAAEYVRHLDEYPSDNEARENLALIYARHYRRLDLATDQLEQLIASPNQPAKQVVHWLNMLADLQVELTADGELARQTLKRIPELYPNTAAEEHAHNRIAHLNLELRPKQEKQAIKLGTYEDGTSASKGNYKRPGGD